MLENNKKKILIHEIRFVKEIKRTWMNHWIIFFSLVIEKKKKKKKK